MMMNQYVILGAVLALIVAGGGGFASGSHYRNLEDRALFQKERDEWAVQVHAIEDAHHKALAQTEADRETLQRYISTTLGPKYAQLSAANIRFQNALADRSTAHAKTELPADDHACDLPAGLFDDWQRANAGPGAGPGTEGLPVSGVDGSLWGTAAAGGTEPGAALPKPPASGGAVLRLRPTP